MRAFLAAVGLTVALAIAPHAASARPMGGSAAGGGSSPLTTFQLTSTNTGTLPFTAAVVLKDGTACGGLITTNATSSQVIIKRNWNSGCAKHALIAGTQALAANTVTITVSTGSGAGGTPLACTDITTANPSATVNLGVSGTVNLSSQFASPLRTWISGPEMVECDYRAVASGGEIVLWYVKLWKSGRIRVDVMVENGWITGNSDKVYTPVITIGGSTVYSPGANITHFANTGYFASAWIGGDPAVTPTPNMTDAIATKLLPNYFMDTPPAAALNGLTQTYVPFGHGDIGPSMGDTGPQNQIGWLGLWDSLWVTSQGDARGYKAAIADALSIYSYPIIWRDPNNNNILKPTDWPNATPNNLGGADALSAGSLTWERSHHGSAGYLAYLFTGEYYMLEAMQLQASLCYLTNDNGTYGTSVNRYLGGQVRSRAWQIRTISQMTAIAPTTEASLADYQTLLTNLGTTDLTLSQQPGFPTLGPVWSYNNGGGGWNSAGAGPSGIVTLNGTTATWMQNFGYWAVAMATDMEALPNMTNWKAAEAFESQWPVGTLGIGGASAYCWNYGGNYGMEVTSDNSNSDDILNIWWKSWALAGPSNFNTDGVTCANTLQGTSGSDPATGSTSFWANLLPAIALAKDHGQTGAAAADTRLIGASNWLTLRNAVVPNDFASYPIFGVQPRPYRRRPANDNRRIFARRRRRLAA